MQMPFLYKSTASRKPDPKAAAPTGNRVAATAAVTHAWRAPPLPPQPNIAFNGLLPDLSRPAAGASQRQPTDIWRVYPSCGVARSESRIALVAPDLAHSHDLASDLAGLDHEVHHCTDRDAMLDSVQARPHEWGLLIFDLDSAADLETGVDDLMDFRTVCPEIPILLLSGPAPWNELSSGQRIVGDATLRKPVLRKHLIEGLETTHLNFAAKK